LFVIHFIYLCVDIINIVHGKFGLTIFHNEEQEYPDVPIRGIIVTVLVSFFYNSSNLSTGNYLFRCQELKWGIKESLVLYRICYTYENTGWFDRPITNFSKYSLCDIMTLEFNKCNFDFFYQNYQWKINIIDLGWHVVKKNLIFQEIDLNYNFNLTAKLTIKVTLF
jgi:hypothetical protein